MNALKLAALFAVTVAGSYSFAAVNLENTANRVAIKLTLHTMPENQDYYFELAKKGQVGSKTVLPIEAGNFIDRITINGVR
jgi:hypothetical protein